MLVIWLPLKKTLGHNWGNSLTHPILITAFLQFPPKGHLEPGLVGFEPRTLQCLNSIHHLSLSPEPMIQTRSQQVAFNLKLDSHLSKKFIFICFNESPLKMMKNAFYFILKALLVLRIFKFVLTFWSCRRNSLIRKTRLISKFLTS